MKTIIGQSMQNDKSFKGVRPEHDDLMVVEKPVVEKSAVVEKPAPMDFDPQSSASIPDSTGAAEDNETHTVSAIYSNLLEAETVRQRLVDRGIMPRQIDILDEFPPRSGSLDDSEDVLKNVVVDGVIGTVVGAGLGAAGTVAMVAGNITLFIASPILAPLAMLGWFAGLGGLVGAAVGAAQKEGKFSDLVHDAIESGNVVLVARTVGRAEWQIAKEVIGASLEPQKIVPGESSVRD